jgi:uncharacterized Fe-S cluster-containing MiaB family protein
LSGEPLIKPDRVTGWEALLQKALHELNEAKQIFSSIKDQLDNVHANKSHMDRVFCAPKFQAYVAGVIEVYKLVKRVQKAVCYFTATQNVPTSNLAAYWFQADDVWKSLFEFANTYAAVTVRFQRIIFLWYN